MVAQSRRRWLRLARLGIGSLMLVSVSAGPVLAQPHQLSVETLIYDLKSPDAGRRQTAAHELSVAKHRPATLAIAALVHDPSDAVRREVELALERLEDPQAIPGFIELASDLQNDIRSRAVAALVNMHLSRASGLGAVLTKLGEVITFAGDRDLEVIVEPDVPVDPAVVSTLRARLADSERGIRRTAIRGLGILRARPAVPDLIQVVREDRDEGLRFEGVRALRKIGDTSIAEDLVSLLNVNDDTVRNELMATLGSMRHRGAVPELTRIVEQARKTDTPRIVALAALADIADPASVPLFEQLKNDASEPMRLYANEGIARTADGGAKSAISAARLVEKSARVRTAQAFALLRIGEGEFLDELIRALDRTTTRELAKEYLLETKPADRQALFAPRSASSTARAELADVLGRIGDPSALPRLQEMAHDSDGDVARAAERATRRIASTSSSQER